MMIGNLSIEFIYEKYWLEVPGWSTYDIAKYYNCTAARIWRFMKREGIPIRTKSEAEYNRWACKIKLEAHPKPMLGKHHSNETKRKIGDKQRGKLGAWYGKHHTKETKMKMSVSIKKALKNLEERE